MSRNELNTQRLHHDNKRYKFVMSIVFGLLGFVGSFFTVKFSYLDVNVNIIWSLIFPLLITLAWGRRYGLLSIFAGLTVFYPFVVGRFNGWACFVPAFVLFVWISIIGWGIDNRFRKKKLYTNVYFLQLVYTGIRVALYFTAFPLLHSFNPPFWYPEANTAIAYGTLALFAVKSFIIDLLLLAVADVIALMPFVRRLLKQDCPNAMRFNTVIVLGMLILSVVSAVVVTASHYVLVEKEYYISWLTDPSDSFRSALMWAAFIGLLLGGVIARIFCALIRATESLEVSEKKYRAIFNSFNDIYIETDEAGVIYTISPSVEKILGYKADGLIGANMICLYSEPESRAKLIEELRLKKNIGNIPISMKGIDGKKHDFLFNIESTEGGSGETKLITIARDVTQYREAEKKLEREILELNAELEKRVDERTAALQNAMGELESFTYTVSHDLKSPLRSIEAYCGILLEDYPQHQDDAIGETTRSIRNISVGMLALVDKLLQYAMASGFELYKESIDLFEMIRDVFTELKQTAGDRQLELIIEDDIPFVSADRILMRQVLTNILSNAVKFTSTRVRAEITVTCALDSAELTLCFRDNGVGFDPLLSKKLFNIFERLHTQDEFEGTGIGLATVKKLIRHQGGRTWIVGEPDRGAAVYVTLPASDVLGGTYV